MSPPACDAAEARRARGALRKLFFAALIAPVLYVFVLESVTVQGSSMEPRLAESDRVIVNKLVYELEGLPSERFSLGRRARRGDVVVLENPVLPGTSMVKRVVGCPGERVRVDPVGRVSVDGRPLEESYVAPPTGMLRSEPVEAALGPDEYFLLGDNREFSTDSRQLGPFKASAIRGEVTLRYWPLSALGFVGN